MFVSAMFDDVAQSVWMKISVHAKLWSDRRPEHVPHAPGALATWQNTCRRESELLNSDLYCLWRLIEKSQLFAMWLNCPLAFLHLRLPQLPLISSVWNDWTNLDTYIHKWINAIMITPINKKTFSVRKNYKKLNKCKNMHLYPKRKENNLCFYLIVWPTFQGFFWRFN